MGLLLKNYWAQWDSIWEEEGVVNWQVVLEGKKARHQILVANSLQSEVFNQLHSAMTGGHMGAPANIPAGFHWVQLKEASHEEKEGTYEEICGRTSSGVCCFGHFGTLAIDGCRELLCFGHVKVFH